MRIGYFAILLGAAAASGCNVDRVEPPVDVVFDTDVAPILAKECVRCHGGATPAAGFSTTTYLETIGCVEPSGDPAVLPRAAGAPILRVLDEPSHRGFATKAEKRILTAWVEAGAPAFTAGVHEPGIIDPRSPAFHGAMLRQKRWSQMLDPKDPEACGRCHDGTMSRPAGVTLSAPGATACTTCHDQPEGILACGTCHGDGARASPPRDLCFFPKDLALAGAHLAHTEPSAASSTGLDCKTCHPVPGADVISGLHGNGSVEVVFDSKLVPSEASFDAKTGACAVSCHNLGGTEPRPTWSETKPMDCNSCHTSPPANHFGGPCSECHRDANADGTKLTGNLHMNGRVDLGDGSGGCGACHGKGDDPWPSTGAHAAHHTPTLSSEVACSDCHIVPATVLAPGHFEPATLVVFSGIAQARSSDPVWNGTSCTNVACHGANLVDTPAVIAPAWNDTSGAASACGACHPIPPTQHTTSTSCGRSTCHSGETAPATNGFPFITAAGRSLHVNGMIDVGAP